MLVQDGILVLPEFINHWLDPQHQELIPEMQAEFQVILSSASIEDSIDEGHDGCLQVYLIPVAA